MGIQINGSNDTISATDGGLSISGQSIDNANLNLSQNLNVTGIATVGTLNATQSNPTNINVSGVSTVTNLRATNINLSGITTGLNVSGVTTSSSVIVGSAVTISATGINAPGIGITVANINDGPLSGARNRIINGDMRIDQRNAGAAVTSNSGFPVDRWITYYAGGGVYSGQRSTTAPAGFINSLLLTVTTADSSIAATDNYLIRHNVEGFNVDDLAWGTASAKTVTLSFWVRSSVTGTYGGSLTNDGENRSYPFSYTISTANTFEYKTITIPGDTTGTWLTNSSRGVAVNFALGMGATYSGTAGAWASALYISSTGATNWIATNGATFYITGVQLEAGSVATPFERRSYGQELALCQRYYQQYSGNQKMLGSGYMNSSTAMYRWGFPLGIEMRASPTLAFNGDIRVWGGSGSTTASATSTISTSYCQTNFVDADITCSGVTTTAGLFGKVIINTATASVSLSAEL